MLETTERTEEDWNAASGAECPLPCVGVVLVASWCPALPVAWHGAAPKRSVSLVWITAGCEPCVELLPVTQRCICHRVVTNVLEVPRGASAAQEVLGCSRLCCPMAGAVPGVLLACCASFDADTKLDGELLLLGTARLLEGQSAAQQQLEEVMAFSWTISYFGAGGEDPGLALQSSCCCLCDPGMSWRMQPCSEALGAVGSQHFHWVPLLPLCAGIRRGAGGSQAEEVGAAPSSYRDALCCQRCWQLPSTKCLFMKTLLRLLGRGNTCLSVSVTE